MWEKCAKWELYIPAPPYSIKEARKIIFLPRSSCPHMKTTLKIKIKMLQVYLGLITVFIHRSYQQASPVPNLVRLTL
jgi:hypothetical protein